MVFSSLIFLYGFFSISLLCCSLCRNRRAQNTVLLIFSLIFYSWGEPRYVFLLMAMAMSSWVCALGIRRAGSPVHRRLWLIAAAVTDIGLIGWFKYAGLLCSVFGPVPAFIRNIALPIGISFYTFQLLTYVVDVYRGEAEAQESYWNVLLYAALFHQCIAGPIVRYSSIDRELFSGGPRTPEWAPGVSRFCAGLAKKVLLANPCGALADALILSAGTAADPGSFAANFQALSTQSVLGSWVGMIAYCLHIYLDFSAYSDMAIGMGRMLGLHYPENFNYPYVSRSIQEFWRRWHMTLGSFFRDYVYIPMGGSRCAWYRTIFNSLVVWALTGLWHGASWNYVVWGLYFFVLLMLERFCIRRPLEKLPVLSHLYLLTAVLLGVVIFRFTDMRLGLCLIRSLFGLNGNPLTDFASLVQLKSNLFLLAAAVIASTPLAKLLGRHLQTLAMASSSARTLFRIGFYSLLPVVLLLLSTACLVGDSYNPFIYFQF